MENIFTSSKPFLTVAKFIGFFPMTVTHNSMKVKWFDIFMTCCSSTALFAMNIDRFLNLKYEDTFLKNAWSVIRTAELFSYIFLFAYQLHARKKIFIFLKDMHKFDEKVR
jgi:hypothetical protein